MPDEQRPSAVRWWVGQTGKSAHPALIQGPWAPTIWPGATKTAPQDKATAEEAKRKAIGDQASNLRRAFAETRPLIAEIQTRQSALTDTGVGRAASSSSLTVASRVVIGFGLQNALTPGFLLHPLYGVPYLPGSAIKGATQSFLLQAYAREARVPRLSPEVGAHGAGGQQPPSPIKRLEELLTTDPGEKTAWARAAHALERALQATDAWWTPARQNAFGQWLAGKAETQARVFRLCFGAPGRGGSVAYLDAFPEALTIEIDVLTPHQQPYYTEATRSLSDSPATVSHRPGDYYDPVPISFLTIAPDVSRFRVVVVATDPTRIGNEVEMAKHALHFVELALEVHGIGAKTSSGYGRLRPS